MSKISFADVQACPEALALIHGANEVMKAMGYTEHGTRHTGIVAARTWDILTAIGWDERTAELGQIAAWLHDVGCVINRLGHPVSGANLAFPILRDLGMSTDEIAPVLGAIGNHEELNGSPISPMSAALILADKSDVDRSRVQNPVMESFDIHDRVNYSVTRSELAVDADQRVITLRLKLETAEATVMEYFEIFLSRMVMCRRAASVLGCRFRLEANGTILE